MIESRFAFCCVFLAVAALAACDDEDETTMANAPLLPAGGSGGTGGSAGEVELVARGQYLVDNLAACADCHTPRDAMGAHIEGQYLAGAECFIRLDSGVCLHTSNLTNHETGLASRTDAEIRRMIVDGIRSTPTGDEILNPEMPFYAFHNLTDRDVDSIVAYLRTVPGVEHAVPPRAPEIVPPGPVNPLDKNAVPSPAADYPERQSALRGRYLAAESGPCIICHTPRDLQAADILDLSRAFTGNEVFDVGLPEQSVARNITSDTETGIGDYSVDDIVTVLKQGKDKNGDGICPPMLGLFAGLTDGDALDIAHYIKSLAPAPGLAEDQCVLPPM